LRPNRPHLFTIKQKIMLQIRTLAPTLIDALKAVELGCRKVQNDPFFVPEMLEWMTICDDICFGCLATIALMHLTGKSGADVVNSFDPESFPSDKAIGERAAAFGLYLPIDNFYYSDVSLFERAINYLREGTLSPLLEFYGLHTHPNAISAAEWLNQDQNPKPDFGTTKDDLLLYADFIKDALIPKIATSFADEPAADYSANNSI
jgi:hypothetical protein